MRQPRVIKLSKQAQSVWGNFQIATSSRDDVYNSILSWLREFNERLRFEPIDTLGKLRVETGNPNTRIETHVIANSVVEVFFDVSDDDSIEILDIWFDQKD